MKARPALRTVGRVAHVVIHPAAMLALGLAAGAGIALAGVWLVLTGAAAGYVESPGCAPVTALSSTIAVQQHHDCMDAATVRSLLLDAGATEVTVHVNSEASTSLLGPERVKHVLAQVEAPATQRASWNAVELRRAIALTVGTDQAHVALYDDRLRPLTPRSGQPPVGVGPARPAPTAAR